MSRVKTYFTPSTNLAQDIGNKSILDNIVVTNQILDTLNAFSLFRNNELDNSAVSIVGPYGSGKSTTALVLYHYLTNSLPKEIHKKLADQKIELLEHPYSKREIKVILGQKISLERSLKKFFKIRKDLPNHIKNKFIKKGQRLVLIIDEFGKYLEYSSDAPKNGDVYILQELAELAFRSNGSFKLITIRHQAIMGYFSGLRSSYLNEWKKIQGRFYDIVHSNTIEDTLTLIAPNLDRFSNDNYAPPKKVKEQLINNPAIGDISNLSLLKNCFPFHPFSVLLLVSAYKRFAQNERSVFTFLNTNERFGIKYFTDSTDGIYRICDFYDYIYLNMEHYILESPFYQDWNKIETALRDLKTSKDTVLIKNFEVTQSLIKTIGLLNLFGAEIGLKADDDTLSAALLTKYNKSNQALIKELVSSLQKENIITFNNYLVEYHLWHGALTNINELINKTIEEQKGSVDLAKQLERLAPNDPIIAKKHLIKTGTFRCIELKYLSVDDLLLHNPTNLDGVVYIFIATNQSQKDKITQKLQDHRFHYNEEGLVILITPKLENQIREYIAASYLENNNEQLKNDKVGREELSYLRYHLSQSVESIIKNHKILNVKMFWVDMSSVQRLNYKEFSTNKINEWISSLYKATPVIKNELVNRDRPSTSAMFGVRKLLTAMLSNSHIRDFGINTNGPEKSIYLSVLHETCIHRSVGGKYEFVRPKDQGLGLLWDEWDELIQNTRDDNDRISVRGLIELACEKPYGLKKGLAHLLAIIKVFSDLGQVSVYHRRHMEQDFMYLAKIEKDTIELLTKRPENFEVKFVDSKIHQSLFSELYQYLNEDHKDITTLLDVARSIIEKINSLKQRTIKTRAGISKHAQQFIKEVRDARSPEDLIYKKIPISLGLEPITSKRKISSKIYVDKLQDVVNEIHEFEQNIFPFIKQQIIGVWDLGLKYSAAISDVKMVMIKKLDKAVLHWVFDEKLKEFVNRSLDKDRNGGDWLESVASHLVGKLPDKWSDDEIPIFIDQLRFMKIQYEESESLYLKNKAMYGKDNINTEAIEDEIGNFVDGIDASEEEKQLAIIRLYNKYVRSKEKN